MLEMCGVHNTEGKNSYDIGSVNKKQLGNCPSSYLKSCGDHSADMDSQMTACKRKGTGIVYKL